MRKPEEFSNSTDKMLYDTAKTKCSTSEAGRTGTGRKTESSYYPEYRQSASDGGNKKVLELHGSVYRNYCMKCHRFYDFAHMKVS